MKSTFAKLLLTASSLTFCISAAFAQDPIRVGAWNIETLGAPNSRDYPNYRPQSGHGVARDPEKVADQIEALDVDVLALEEIYDTDNDRDTRTNSILDDAFEIINDRSSSEWKYELYANRDRQDTDQICGVAWDESRVQPVGRRLRIAVTDRTTREFAEWDRHPHAMQFTRGNGRTDFVVVPIHMKAGGGDQEQREAEAKSLVVELDEIRAHFGDNDIILIGDFNMGNRDEPAGEEYRSGGLWDLNYFDRDTHVTNRPLDRCYIPASERAAGHEFPHSQLEILAPSPSERQAFRRDLSDHWPVVLTFQELADDD